MGFRDDGQYTQITNGTTVLATATDGSVRQIILGVSGFSAGLTTGREVMTGADGNQMDTESFLASLHVLTTNDIKDRGGILLLLLVKKFLSDLLLNNMVKVSYLVLNH
jgi:hypothetical protein